MVVEKKEEDKSKEADSEDDSSSSDKKNSDDKEKSVEEKKNVDNEIKEDKKSEIESDTELKKDSEIKTDSEEKTESNKENNQPTSVSKPITFSKVRLWQCVAGFFFLTTLLLLFFPIGLFDDGTESLNQQNEEVALQQNDGQERGDSDSIKKENNEGNQNDNNGNNQKNEEENNQNGQEENKAPERADVDVDDDPMLGEEDAPVTIVAFEDYQCPFCKRVSEQALPRIKQEYIDTGKVRFVFRDFPLANIHPQAVAAAMASECANEQGKFWEYHDDLYANQGSLSHELYEELATKHELDVEQFMNCFSSSKYASEIQNDFQEGIDAGVDGTPAYFINGIKIVGSHPYENFKQIIDSELV